MWPSQVRAGLLRAPFRASRVSDLAFLDRIASRKSTVHTFPRWMMYELHVGNITREQLDTATERVESFESPSDALKGLVADGSSLPKKLINTSLADFVTSICDGKKAKLECIGRAKAAAFACEVLERPYRIMGNETHMYVTDLEDGQVYDFKFNLTYRKELKKRKNQVPSYYFKAAELDDSGVLSTLILDSKVFDADEKLLRLRKVYPRASGKGAPPPPVWVRVFLYENESPLDVYSDAEALSHPFVCLSFAELLGSVALLQQSLMSLDCHRFEFDDDFFYQNEDGVSFLSVVKRMWAQKKLHRQPLLDVTHAAKERAQACAPEPVPKRFADKVDAFLEKELGLGEKRKRRGRERQ